jgi:hypothetical protein
VPCQNGGRNALLGTQVASNVDGVFSRRKLPLAVATAQAHHRDIHFICWRSAASPTSHFCADAAGGVTAH